jgi:hypothetical protein
MRKSGSQEKTRIVVSRFPVFLILLYLNSPDRALVSCCRRLKSYVFPNRGPCKACVKASRPKRSRRADEWDGFRMGPRGLIATRVPRSESSFPASCTPQVRLIRGSPAGAKDTKGIGEIRGLVLIWEILEPGEMKNRVEFL